MGCCSTDCAKWSRCKKAREGEECVDWACNGCGSWNENGVNKTYYYCGELGSYVCPAEDGLLGVFPQCDVELLNLKECSPETTILILRPDTDQWDVEAVANWAELIQKEFPQYQVICIPKNMDFVWEYKDKIIETLENMLKKYEKEKNNGKD